MGCHAWRQFDTPDVIARLSATGKASYRGLQTCKSVWTCPFCSMVKSRHRRQRLADLVQSERRSGKTLCLLTWKIQHRSDDPLTHILDNLKSAYHICHSGKFGAAWRDQIGYSGSVRSLEITYGLNGHHPHFHELISMKERIYPGEAQDYFHKLRTHYLDTLDGLGAYASYDQSLDARVAYGSIHSYVGKWGIVPELVSNSTKRGKADHVMPFQLLDQALDGQPRAYDPARVFKEYFAATFGVRQLVPSPSFRSFMRETPNDKKVDASDYQDFIISAEDWDAILRDQRRAAVLEEYEKGDY